MPDNELECRVINLKMVTPTVFVLTFEPSRRLEFVAGQFVSVVIPGAGPKGRDLRRAYSIASPPEIEHLELCIKLVEKGPGTRYLYSLKAGEIFKGFAPYGDFVFKTPPDRHACFIATGTGIAPFRAMIQSRAYQAAPPQSALCLAGARTEDELLYREELRLRKDVRLITAVSQPMSREFEFSGRVTDYLRKVEAEIPWKETDFYLCGNGAMIEEVKLLLGQHGVEKTHIHQEVYYKPPKPAAAPAS